MVGEEIIISCNIKRYRTNTTTAVICVKWTIKITAKPFYGHFILATLKRIFTTFT